MKTLPGKYRMHSKNLTDVTALLLEMTNVGDGNNIHNQGTIKYRFINCLVSQIYTMNFLQGHYGPQGEEN